MKNKNIKTKKFLSFLIAVVFMLSLMPLSFAADEVTLSGDGTADNPYLIGTEAELIAFRKAVAENLATLAADAGGAVVVSKLCGKLTDNISLASPWIPIAVDGTQKKLYGGTFDGNGYTISNMTATMKAVQGFVSESGEGLVIKNLTVDGEYNSDAAQTYTGGFVGRAHAPVTFINCVNKINITGTDRVAGFVGNGNYSHSFTNCANYGDITGTTNVNGFLATGGSIDVTYENCVNYGDIVADTASVVAGFSGAGTYTNCIGYGSVTNSGPATATYNAWGNATISGTNCYYRSGVVTGSVTPNGGTSKTSAQFASGELTYLLNGNSAENVTWGQDLENDLYPVYGKTDYPVYYIADQDLYSNKNEVIGTESNPYLIATEAQLKAFRDKVNAGETTLCAKLTDDITLTSAWSKMGISSYKYAGIFDGNGYTIKGFSIVNGDVRGFVGEGGVGLVIKNLTLEGTMTGVNHSAAFIGRANGAATIDNCVNKVNVSGTHTLGGFVGITSSAVVISNCKNYGNITATSATATDSYTGAFIGRENTSASSVTNSANYGDITGLTGVASGILYSGKVTNSYNVGTVSNVGGEAAPIAHWAKNGVTNSYYIADKISGKTVLQTYGTAKSASAFSSGEVTYLLNGSTAENATWGQELGVDEYPVFGKTDYPVYKHDYIYSNSSEVFGTESNPYLIGTEAELIAFKDIVSKDAQASENGVSKLCAKLTADIGLTSVWTGIGTSSYRYGGVFDGAGYTISNLTGLETAWGFGLVSFGGEGLTFKNLTIDGSMTVKGQAAGFVGNVNSAVKFENCVNKVDITATADGEAAGFIGGAASSTPYEHSFKNCVNYGNITGTKVAAVAGFVGAFSAKANTFENCANFGTITGTGGAVLAGIASNGTLKNCVGYGAVINSNGPATTTCNKFGGTLTNCYYLENVTTSSNNVDGGTKMTANDFASGKVAYLLNKNAMEIICGQDLTTDSYPMFGKDSNVYYNMGSYSNDTGVFLAANADSAVFMATEGATAYVAQYASNGALINVETVDVTAQLGNYSIIADANATNVKVFLWGANMKPLCEGEIAAF